MHRRPPTRFNVLLATDHLGYPNSGIHGGGQLLVAWTQELRRRGIGVTTAVMRGGQHFRGWVAERGLAFEFLDRPQHDPRTIGDLVRLCRRDHVDLVHLQGHGASTFGRLAAAHLALPSLVHIHADYRVTPRGYPFQARAADRLLAPLTRRVMAVSESTRRFALEAQGYRPEQVEVLPNPVDRDKFARPTAAERREARAALDIAPEARVAVTVGRVDWLKGVDVQIAAWADVVARVPDALLLVVGDGVMRPRLEAAVAARPWRDQVRFLGVRSDVERVLWAADVFVLSSRSEGMPLVLLEAMSTGLPVVGTRAGGIPDVVAEGTNGFLADVEDADTLARHVVRVLRDPGLRARLADGADRSAERYALADYVDRLVGVYRRVIVGAPAPAFALRPQAARPSLS
jgi:glycosyltransferase involved in cell wall biosynthesis